MHRKVETRKAGRKPSPALKLALTALASVVLAIAGGAAIVVIHRTMPSPNTPVAPPPVESRKPPSQAPAIPAGDLITQREAPPEPVPPHARAADATPADDPPLAQERPGGHLGDLTRGDPAPFIEWSDRDGAGPASSSPRGAPQALPGATTRPPVATGTQTGKPSAWSLAGEAGSPKPTPAPGTSPAPGREPQPPAGAAKAPNAAGAANATGTGTGSRPASGNARRAPQRLAAVQDAQCGNEGFLSRLICMERVRLRFCRDRWNAHPDCIVESARADP